MLFVFFKQKTAYELRISDGSSDVCSSDLDRRPPRPRHLYPEDGRREPVGRPLRPDHRLRPGRGRPDVRARRGQDLPPPDLLQHPGRRAAHLMASLPPIDVPKGAPGAGPYDTRAEVRARPLVALTRSESLGEGEGGVSNGTIRWATYL